MKKLIALALALCLAAPVADAAWLLVDEDGNLVHHPQNLQEGEPWVDSDGLFLGFWIWV